MIVIVQCVRELGIGVDGVAANIRITIGCIGAKAISPCVVEIDGYIALRAAVNAITSRVVGNDVIEYLDLVGSFLPNVPDGDRAIHSSARFAGVIADRVVPDERRATQLDLNGTSVSLGMIPIHEIGPYVGRALGVDPSGVSSASGDDSAGIVADRVVPDATGAIQNVDSRPIGAGTIPFD
jgi:hypothetical protein